MSIGDTVKKWGKDARKAQHEPVNTHDQMMKKRERPTRKLNERVRKMAAKMKHEGYPSRFTSAKEQQTHD